MSIWIYVYRVLLEDTADEGGDVGMPVMRKEGQQLTIHLASIHTNTTYIFETNDTNLI